MKKKELKQFIYDGLGFPIKLKNVTLLLIDKVWCPKIDVRKLSNMVIKELPFQKERLTGNQIKFIRTYFRMSLRDFAKKVVKESHTAVAKWEKLENKSTNMDVNIEAMLRLFVYEQVAINTKKHQQGFFEKYMLLREMDFVIKTPSPLLMEAV
jgi:DNA-binding transcriptional regulator YiaG